VLLELAGRATIATGDVQTRRDWVHDQLTHSVHIHTMNITRSTTTNTITFGFCLTILFSAVNPGS